MVLTLPRGRSFRTPCPETEAQGHSTWRDTPQAVAGPTVVQNGLQPVYPCVIRFSARKARPLGRRGMMETRRVHRLVVAGSPESWAGETRGKWRVGLVLWSESRRRAFPRISPSFSAFSQTSSESWGERGGLGVLIVNGHDS